MTDFRIISGGFNPKISAKAAPTFVAALVAGKKTQDVQGEDLWQWFQTQDTNPKNDAIEKDGKRNCRMNAQEATKVLGDIGLYYEKWVYEAAINQASDGLMDGSAFVRYVRLVTEQELDEANARQSVLKFKKESKYIPTSAKIDKGFFASNEESRRTLFKILGHDVALSNRAGGYYCEHVGFVLNDEAEKPGSSILKSGNAPLIGALHIPAKDDDREDNTRMEAPTKLMALAVRGYFDAMRSAKPSEKEYRIAITGFAPFTTAEGAKYTSNISGDYVSWQKNIDDTLQTAFPDMLVEEAGTSTETANGTVITYKIRESDKAAPITLKILTKKITAGDESIDNGKHSVQQMMRSFKPHAAITIGADVTREKDFSISTHLYNENMKKSGSGYIHAADTDDTQSYINYTLGFAIGDADKTLKLGSR